MFELDHALDIGQLPSSRDASMRLLPWFMVMRCTAWSVDGTISYTLSSCRRRDPEGRLARLVAGCRSPLGCPLLGFLHLLRASARSAVRSDCHAVYMSAVSSGHACTSVWCAEVCGVMNAGQAGGAHARLLTFLHILPGTIVRQEEKRRGGGGPGPWSRYV